MVGVRLYDAVEVQHRRRHVGLREHVVYLTSVVRLVIEEVRHQKGDRVVVDFALVVDVANSPAEELFVQAGGEHYIALARTRELPLPLKRVLLGPNSPPPTQGVLLVRRQSAEHGT